MRSIAVTGATGFIGEALVNEMAQGTRFAVVALSRSRPHTLVANARYLTVEGPTETTEWQSVLAGVDVLVHTAARVHVKREVGTDALAEFRRVNVEGTLNLAGQAASAGVKRFVFISSVGVHGGESRPGRPFRTGDDPAPNSAYAQSKWETEQGLRVLEEKSAMEVVVVRPPPVYGRGAPGNFGRLMRCVQRGTTLPLGAVDNMRSFVGLDNLVDLLVRCVDHPNAAGQTFLVSDGEDLSTPELVRRLARAAGRRARLLPVPPQFMRMAGRLAGRGGDVDRLLASLQVDIGNTRAMLDWSPPVSVNEGLRRAVAGV
jgi:nucleoside-diphosphate-sugar epimerase